MRNVSSASKNTPTPPCHDRTAVGATRLSISSIPIIIQQPRKKRKPTLGRTIECDETHAGPRHYGPHASLLRSPFFFTPSFPATSRSAPALETRRASPPAARAPRDTSPRRSACWTHAAHTPQLFHT